jgi:hypothetical protein
VYSAQDFNSLLKCKGYGPDILSEVPNSDLGIPPGNIIQLKKGSEVWWKKTKKDQPHNFKIHFFSNLHTSTRRQKKMKKTTQPGMSTNTLMVAASNIVDHP